MHAGVRTSTGVEAVVCARDLDSCGALVDDPVLSASAVAVPAGTSYSECAHPSQHDAATYI